jgi:hypothetical protein
LNPLRWMETQQPRTGAWKNQLFSNLIPISARFNWLADHQHNVEGEFSICQIGSSVNWVVECEYQPFCLSTPRIRISIYYPININKFEKYAGGNEIAHPELKPDVSACRQLFCVLLHPAILIWRQWN